MTWPKATKSTVDLTVVSADGNRTSAAAAGISSGGTVVTLADADTTDVLSAAGQAGPGLGRATITLHSRDAATKAGVDGIMLSVARADGRSRADRTTVRVNYRDFANAYGGDWASRLRLVALPECALSTPDKTECRQGTPLATRNDPTSSTLTANTIVPGTGVSVLAVQPGPTGDNGDYTATPLKQAGTWNVGPQTGDFSWSEPLRTPPALGGPAPALGFAYSSGAIDGLTSTSNNQGGWVGDGWSMWPGSIDRKYASCNDDNPGHKTGDQCWSTSNATLSLNGHSGELIETATANLWRLKNDDGTKVEKLTDANRSNGDNDNEYWKVTTTDGIQYFFGYHKLPNWATGNLVTDSVWTVPVFGNNSGEPCYNATFANAWCQQAWRWNLDYVLDANGNSMAYFYGKETGAYGRDLNANQYTTYTRGGWLDHIDYGMRTGGEYSQAAPLKVTFATAERCLSGCWTGTPWTSNPNPSAWVDTPWDQNCTAAPCTNKLSPTFWSARRLTKVTTQTRNGTSSYADVESWTLRHEFLSAGDNEGSPMWLRGITHAGLVTTAGGATVTDPEIVFDPGAEPLANRVDGPADGRASLTRFRIKTITTESGGQINIVYSATECTKATLPTPEANTKRCFPSFYAPSGTPTLDWFHKYVVIQVNLHDTSAQGTSAPANPDQTTFYDYLDAPAWHYTDDEITKDAFKTWGDWRGYGRVQVRTGATGATQTATEYRFMRGMDGDHLPSGVRDVWVNDTWGGTLEDHEALNGFTRQTITFNGVGGTEVTSTFTDPWTAGPTATRTRNGVTVNAWKTNPGTTRTRTALEAGGYRYAKTTPVYNTDGLVTTVDDFGDEAVNGDETCTRTTYARNDTTWMINRVSQAETLNVTCANASTPATQAQVLAQVRHFYDTYVDGSSFGAAPTAGNEVRTEELDSWNAGAPGYVASASTKYDANGRVIEVTDARGNKTTTGYTTANGGLVTQTTVTNALNHAAVSTVEPAWGLPTRVTDANSTITDITYDGAGQITAVWVPGRNKASFPTTPSARFTYLLRSSGGPTAVTSEKLMATGSAYKKTITLYDGFLNERQTQEQATGGGRLITDILHDSAGRAAWSSMPYYDTTNTAVSTTLAAPTGALPSVTEHVYDGAGRETASIFKADGTERWRTTTAYGGDRVHISPYVGGTQPYGGVATTTISDIRGNTTALRQYRSYADVGSTSPAKYVQTSYTYTLLGQQKTITDAAGNTWTNTYDLRGRQVQNVDPDKGTSSMTYTPTGQVETVTAPLGATTKTTAFTYDVLDRKTSMRDDTITGNVRASWVYDTLANGKGKLTSATRYSGGNAYTQRTDTFDAYGRPTSTSLVLPAAAGGLCAAATPNTCTYTTTMTYKANGQLATTTLPAAADLPSEKLSFGYTDVGEQAGYTSAAQIYVYDTTYNKLGQLTQRNLGAYGSRISQTYGYDEPTRRLNSLNVVPELKPEAANYTYSYDNAGELTKLTDAPAGQTADTQCYTYDFLQRLTDAWTPGSGSCTTAPSLAGLGGPAPYWTTWTIDDLGNRTSETRHAATNTAYTYTYPAAGGARPHAVSSIVATGGATNTRTYTYDNAGNTKTRTTNTGTTQTLTWDREGHLLSTDDGTSNIYDPDGNRLIRTDTTGSTLYMGQTEIRLTGTVAKATRYYTHHGDTIATRTTTSLNWIIPDHHGTAEETIDSTTLTTAKRRTNPYGDPRGTTVGTWPTTLDKGLAGGTNDPTGLTHLGAREYDPFLGRFISVDPLLDPGNPQTLEGYLYSNNNPATYSDPTGKSWGWLAVAVVAVIVVAVVVAVVCPAVIPALVSAGTAALEAGTAAAAAGAGAGATAVAAGGAAAAELAIAAGTTATVAAAAGTAGVVGLGTVGLAGRTVFGGDGDGPMFGGLPRPRLRNPKGWFAPNPDSDPGVADENGFVYGTNKPGYTTSRPSWRSDADHSAWRRAQDGENGGKACQRQGPNCVGEVFWDPTNPEETRARDWAKGHWLSWANRKWINPTREQVIDDYHDGFGVECVPCNSGLQNNGDDYFRDKGMI